MNNCRGNHQLRDVPEEDAIEEDAADLEFS